MSTKNETSVHHGKQLEYLMEHSALTDAAALSAQLKCTPSAIYQMVNKSVLKHGRVMQICNLFGITTDDFYSGPLKGLSYEINYPKPTPLKEKLTDDQRENLELKERIIELQDEISGLKDKVIDLNQQIITIMKG